MNNTIKRTFAIIDHLTENPNCGITDLSNELEMPKSTVHNIIGTLNNLGLIERSEGSTKYHLGVKLVELGYRAQNDIDICRIGQPYLRGLNEDLDETVHLTILDQDQVLYVDCIESRKRLRTYSVIGVRAPLYCTSVGKAILAFLKEEEIERIIAQYGLPRMTENTITEPHLMREELAKIKRLGYAVDNMEHEAGLRCCGAPIFNSKGEVVASLSISGPANRITEAGVIEIAPLVISAANEISHKLGHR